MKEQQPIPRGGIGYRVFKHYVRFLHSRVFYKKVYYIGKENIPEQGVPVVFASNHQNCACDPLLLLLGLENESHPYVVARGDVFGKSPIADKFFNWLGLVPAFRLNFDGAEALQKNEAMLATTEQKLLEGNRLIIFPEGGHQDKHYLGEFSFGYTRLAFQAAEKANFEKDIVIVPCCNHYSDYFEVKTEALYRFGEPVHLQPYYELYKTKPRTAQREVNKIVRQRIQAMMLDVQDVENYDVVEFMWDKGVRIKDERRISIDSENSNTKVISPLSCVLYPSSKQPLPVRLEAEKAVVAALAKEKAEQPEVFEARCKEVRNILAECKKRHLDYRNLHKGSVWRALGYTLLSLLILPVWIVSLWPNLLLYTLPLMFLKTDKMFTNTWRLILAVVVGVPFFLLLTLFVAGFGFGWWWQALAWILLYPLTVDIAWYGWKHLQRTVQEWKMI
ncbi:MAG: 1-acyl-sn-glycerol-3-phosphate acyltransferase [Bacteroidales bacterium]|nr:1-acyl-sn-glycerol-3-phosphate acyltransferase [Bacteroidales bacterium]